MSELQTKQTEHEFSSSCMRIVEIKINTIIIIRSYHSNLSREKIEVHTVQ